MLFRSKIRGAARPVPVRVSATSTSGATTATVVLKATGESAATAQALATAVGLIGEAEPGVWLPEQAFTPASFLDELISGTDMTIAWSGLADHGRLTRDGMAS